MQRNTRFTETNTLTLIQHERNYRHHLTRLLDISAAKGPLTTKQKSVNDHDILLQKKQEYLRRKQNRRLFEIQKDNSKLLTKLMQINTGKEKKPSKSQPKISLPVNENERSVPKENSPRANSHHINRKKEFLRILNENSKMSDRLVLRESNFSRDKMDQEYQQSREYSNRIRRVRIRSDKTLEVGSGGVKFSKDLRIISHNPYLPPLHPITTHTLRSSSVSRLHTESQLNSCRSTEKVSHNAIVTKYRQKPLKTEADVQRDSFLDLRRRSNPDLLQILESGASTDRVYTKNEFFEEEIQAKKSDKSPMKYRQGDFIFQDVSAKEESTSKAFEREKSYQSKQTEDRSFIKEESQAREESVQRSYYESKQMQMSEVGRIRTTEDNKEIQNIREPQSTEEYDEIFEAESAYESKRIEQEKLKKEFSTRSEQGNQIMTEEYVEDYESLTESQKGTH